MNSNDSRPWTEKYRPIQLRGVAFQTTVVRVLQTTLSDMGKNDVPNLLFYGPPGTGKTSTIAAISRQWFPTPQLYRERVLELNASDERGIASVRDVVIAFARQPVLPDPAGKIPPFRLLILDEADAMTEKAQASLRRVMERYATYTRFCLLCNYLSGLLAPLVSRCAVFYFRSPSPSQMSVRLDLITQRENLRIGKDETEHKAVLTLFAQHSDGDMRKALHWLQCLNLMWTTTRKTESQRCDAELAKTVLNNMSARPPQSIIVGLVAILVEKKQYHFATTWFHNLYSKILNQGYSVTVCLQMICETLLKVANVHPEMADKVCEYVEKLSEIDAALHKGADAHIQLLSLFHPLLAAK